MLSWLNVQLYSVDYGFHTQPHLCLTLWDNFCGGMAGNQADIVPSL